MSFKKNHPDALLTEVEAESDELERLRQNRKKRRKKLTRRRKIILLGIIIVFAAAAVALNWGVIAPSAAAETIEAFFSQFGASKYPVSIASGGFKRAAVIGSNIGVLTDTSILIYSQKGTLLANRPLGMSDPQIQAQGGKAVVYDRGGKTLKVETRFSESFALAADNPIISAAVGRSGALAVVTESKNYLGELTVYNVSNNQIFKWYSASGRILCAALSPDGSQVAALVIGSSNGDYKSSIYVFNVGKQTPVSQTDYDGTLLFSIQYGDSGRIAAVGKNQTVFQDDSGKNASSYDYSGRTLLGYAQNGNVTALVFGVYSSSSGSQIVTLSSSGAQLGNTTLGTAVGSISVQGNSLAALTGNGVYYADTSFKSSGNISDSGDALDVMPISGYVYIFGLETISSQKMSE